MIITEADIHEIQAKMAPLLGQKAWGASLGVGSFITLEFGVPLPRRGKHGRTHGEWHLWIYMCGWRLEKGNEVLGASEDPRPKLEAAVKGMEGLALHSVELLRPAWDTIFTFEDQVVLRTFSIYSNSEENDEYWKLFAPDGNILLIGPGTRWSYESAFINRPLPESKIP